MTSLADRAADILGYEFENAHLIEAALTHPSMPGGVNYQRLEFLGDRVLGVVIAAWLFEIYPHEPEGKLNRRYTALVRRETLADICLDLGLDALIRLEQGAEAEGTRETPAVLSDVCEAVIGAMYIDSGLDAARSFIREHWGSRVKAGPGVFKDSKTALQEWAQARHLPLPSYRVVERSGPDHDPEFTIAVSVEGQGERAARGSSKRAAEQAAAARLLEDLMPDRGAQA